MSLDLCTILIVSSSLLSVQTLCVFEQVCHPYNYSWNQYQIDVDPGIPTSYGLGVLPMAGLYLFLFLPSSYYVSGSSISWRWNLFVVIVACLLFLSLLTVSILLLVYAQEEKHTNELTTTISSSWNQYPRSVKNYYGNVNAIVERRQNAIQYIGLWALEYALVTFIVATVQYKKMEYKLSWGNLGK